MSLRKKLVWLSVLYVAEGLPMGVYADLAPVFLRQQQAPLTLIGLLSLLGLPWSLKLLWSPLVDRFPFHRVWVSACLAIVALSLTFMAMHAQASGVVVVVAALAVLCLASATQDIAIDAYSIHLVGRGEEGMANGVRLAAYRVALIASGGGAMLLVRPWGWGAAFAAMAGAAALLAVCAAASPRVTVVRDPNARAWAAALWHWVRRPGARSVFLFALVYKLGDASMGPMIKPFWVDRGLSTDEIALVSTTAGALATIAGSLVGGWYTSRAGIVRALWVLGLAQALSNLGYAVAAGAAAGRLGIYAASVTESFCGGLGSAAFLAFLMRACERERAATEYALLSALFSSARLFAGAPSGYFTQTMGYGWYFAFTTLLALPGLLLIRRIAPWAGEEGKPT